MTIRVVGVPLSVGSKEWAQLWQDYATADEDSVVMTGLAVSSAGTRTVSVSAGRSLQGGTRLASDAVFTLPQLAAATTNPYIARIVAQVQWPANDLTDTSLTSGTLVALAGAAAANPVPPALTNTPGTLMQTKLAQVRVNTNGTIVITDERNLANAAATVTFPGTFTASTDGTLLTVVRTGGMVTFGGHVNRGGTALGSSSAGDDTSASWGSTVIIPQGFWPDRVIDIPVRSGGGGPSTAMPTNWLTINPDGTGLLTAGIGNPITAGALIRVATTTWKAA